MHRLGAVTGEMHSILGSDMNDPAFSAETPSVESLGLLTATIDEEIERVFLTLPDGDERLEPILGRGEEVREQLRLLAPCGLDRQGDPHARRLPPGTDPLEGTTG